MKNNLFKKFLALFLTGTMLGAVGCKDYDDDIDDLKSQIDDLKGKIELKADASALQSITDKLKNVDFSAFVTNAQLDTKLAGYVASSKLAEEVKKFGYKTETEILDLISKNTLDQTAINKLIQAQFTLANIWTKEVQEKVQKLIETEIGKIDTSVSDADMTKIKKAVLDAINNDKEVGGIREAISNMVGSGFSGYMAKYIENNAALWAGQVGAAAIAAIDAENSALKAKIMGMIPEGPDYGETGNAAYLSANDLTTVFIEYDSKISAIWSALDDLAGRIQSIVFVPTKVNAEYDVSFGGQFIDADSKTEPNEKTSIMLTSAPKAKITFRVTPAGLAETLAKHIEEGKVTASFIPEKVEVETRAAGEAPVEIEGAPIAEDGKLTFTAKATTSLYDKLEANETYAIALSLKQDKEPNEEGKEGYKSLGFEVVSPYISTSGKSQNVKNNFILAKEDKDGKPVAYKTAAVYPLVWNSTEEKVLLADYKIAYKDGEKILWLDGANGAAATYLWDVKELKYTFAHTAAGSFNDNSKKDQFSINPDPAKLTDKANVNKAVTVKNNAAKQKVENVGAQFEVKDDLTITDGSKKVAWLSGITSQVKITGDTAAELTEINGTVNWKYATYADNNTYSFTVTVPADKAMDWEMFNELKPTDATVVLPKDSKLVPAAGKKIAVTITPVPMLNAESAQQLTVTVENWLNGDGEITFSADPSVGTTATKVNISGKVTFNGLPAFSYAVKNEGAKVGDNYVISYEKINEALYNKSYFADKAEVATFLSGLTLNFDGVKQAGSKADANPIVLPVAVSLENGATLKLAFDGTNIIWEKQASYTYTVPTGTGKGSIVSDNKAFEIKLTGSYTLTNKTFTLEANNLYLKDGKYIELNAGVSGNAVVLNAIDLKRAYDMSDEAQKAGAHVVYTVVKDANDDYKTYGSVYAKDDATKWPSINGSSMSWQNFILPSCTVKAELLDKNNKLCATKTFDVTLVAPIEFDSWNFFEGSVITLPAAGQDNVTFNIVNKVLAMSAEGKEPGTFKEGNKTVTIVPVAKDVLGNSIYTKSGSDYALSTLSTALDGYAFATVEYGDLKWASSPIVGVSFENGVITAVASNESVAATTAEIDVTYKYRFAYEAVKDPKTGKVTGYQMKPFTKTIKIGFKK